MLRIGFFAFLFATVIAQYGMAAICRCRVIAEVAMPVQSIDHINLRVAEPMFRILHDFYRHVLGLVPGNRPDLSSTGAWLYADGRPIVHLIRLDAAAEPCGADAHNGTGLDHVAMQCRGLAQIRGNLTRSGIVHTVAKSSSTGESIVRLRDPSGLQLELIFAVDE